MYDSPLCVFAAPMLAEALGQATEFPRLDIMLRLLILQIVQTQQRYRKPFVGGFKALQAEIADA